MRDFIEHRRTPATDITRRRAKDFAKRKDELRAAIRADTGLTFAEKHVGLRLVDLIHADLQCAWPSAPTLAANVGCDKRTVWRAIKKLDGRHFDRELTGAGRHNAYYPRWPDDAGQPLAPVTQASPPRDTGVTPPVTQASHEIEYLDHEIDPEVCAKDFSSSFVTVDDSPAPPAPVVELQYEIVDGIPFPVRRSAWHDAEVNAEECSVPAEQAAPSAPVARREDETDIDVEADPDAPSLGAQFRAMGSLKAHSTGLTVDGLVEDFVKARQRQRRMGRDPGPTDIGFDRYVKRSIKTHCAEHRDERLRKMILDLGGDPDHRGIRSPERAALDARINQKMGCGRAQA